MKSRLPSTFFSREGKSSTLYLKYIADFNDTFYQQKRSDLLGKYVLEKIRNMEDDPTVSDSGQAKKVVSGNVFELLVAEMLVMHEIGPIYTQVNMWKVPSSKFDYLLFHEVHPVILSCKLSFAERWRQPSIEGILLKNIYRQGKCYVICGDQEHKVTMRNDDIANSAIDGIDRFYIVGSDELLTLFNYFADYPFSIPEKFEPIVSYTRIINAPE